MREVITIPNFQNVAAGVTATLNVPLGERYHGFIMTYTRGAGSTLATEAEMRADIARIRIKIGGKSVRECTIGQMIDLHKFYGLEFEAGILPIYLSEPWRPTGQGEDALAWGTIDVQTFQIELDFASGVVNPRLETKALIERVIPKLKLGGIVQWRTFNLQSTSSGVLNWDNCPRDQVITAIHAFSPNVTAVRVLTESVERFNATLVEANHLYRRHELFPQPGIFTVCFAHTRRVADFLPMEKGGNPATGQRGIPISDMRVDFTLSAASTFTVLLETIGYP